MAWIKRNLLFLIGGLLAVGLLGGAGFYLFKNFGLRQEKREKLTAEYVELDRLTSMSPGPADGKKVDNIKAAKEFQAGLQTFIQRTGKFFEPIAPIPNLTNLTAAEFAAELRNTIGQMQRSAASTSVQLPPNYDFSFSAIKSRITFAPGSLHPLSVQLGEVQALCTVLFKAKINSLDSLRRERVSADDVELADYIEEHSITNELAVLTPYEITFHAFSTELAGVLSGLAGSTHCFIVKNISVGGGGEAAAAGGAPGFTPAATPAYTPAAPIAAPPGARRRVVEEDFYFYDPAPPAPGAPGVPGTGGKMQVVLDEQPLRVTLTVLVVKLNNSPK